MYLCRFAYFLRATPQRSVWSATLCGTYVALKGAALLQHSRHVAAAAARCAAGATQYGVPAATGDLESGVLRDSVLCCVVASVYITLAVQGGSTVRSSTVLRSCPGPLCHCTAPLSLNAM